jgi:hypothetical protein
MGVHQHHQSRAGSEFKRRALGFYGEMSSELASQATYHYGMLAQADASACASRQMAEQAVWTSLNEAPSFQWLVNKNHDTGRLGHEGIHAQRAGPDLEPAEHAAARMTRRNLLRVTGPRTFATKEMDLSRIPGLGSLARQRATAHWHRSGQVRFITPVY